MIKCSCVNIERKRYLTYTAIIQMLCLSYGFLTYLHCYVGPIFKLNFTQLTKGRIKVWFLPYFGGPSPPTSKYGSQNRQITTYIFSEFMASSSVPAALMVPAGLSGYSPDKEIVALHCIQPLHVTNHRNTNIPLL